MKLITTDQTNSRLMNQTKENRMFKVLGTTPVDSRADKRYQQTSGKVTPIVQAIKFSTYKHPSFKNAYNALLDTYDNYGTDSCGCCMFGPPGSGKSRLLRYFLCEIYSRPEYKETDEITPIPVICVSVPGRPTIPKLCEQILKLTQGVYTPIARSGTSPEARVDRMIDELGIKMIIFDEFQHLLREEAAISTAAVLAFIKILMDEHGLAVVFSGKPNAQKLLDDHPELQQRVSYADANLQHFNVKMDGPGNIKEFGSYIKSIELTFKEYGVNSFPIANADMVQRLYIATDGILRLITILFIRVAKLSENEKHITPEILQEAYVSVGFNKRDDFDLFTATKAEVAKYIKKVQQQKKLAEDRKNKHKRGSRLGL